MTPREKILAIGVGSVLVIGGIQYGINQYRAALQTRQNRIQTLDDQVLKAQDAVLQGAYADRMMGEYLVRSLPSDLETARSDYQKWLLLLPELVGLEASDVKLTGERSIGDLYQLLQFKLTANADPQAWVEWLHLFYAKDWLHRISELGVQPRADGSLRLNVTIEVIALQAALPDLPARAEPSPLVDSFAAYADPILNRNLFSRPNQPPQFTSPPQFQVTLGQTPQLNVVAEDPEEHRVKYSIVGEAPPGLVLDPDSGAIRWTPPEVGQFDFIVAAVDNGFPSRRSEQQVKIAVNDPPPPQEIQPAAPSFDEASQTVLTGLVQGSGDWTAWLRVRTQGTTLRLRPGDSFKIGQLSGHVVDVNSRFATLEIDGKQFELHQSGNLAEAAQAAVAAAQADKTNGADAANQPDQPDRADETPPADETAADEAPATGEAPVAGDAPATDEPPADPVATAD